jgi:hypothetical protein
MDESLLSKDKIWNRIKKYFYITIFLFVILFLMVVFLIIITLRKPAMLPTS